MMMRNLLMLISLWPALLFTAEANTFDELDPTTKGLAIAKEMDLRDRDFGNFSADMTMILRDNKGQESIRQMRSRTLEVDNDGDQSLSIFDEPPDVKGTVSLTYSHGLRPDDQWLYLPAIKRVKRINSKNKSGPFMGSEFAFEDIGSQEVDKYTYRYLRDEAINSKPCFVIARYPAYEYSGYSRQIAWVDQEKFIPLQVAFYDRKDSLLKTLTFEDYHQYLDQYWRAHRMLMQNHQTGKSTELRWSNFQFRTDLTARDFDQSALKRAR